MNQLTLIFRDEHIAVFNKPSGLLVHRSPIDRHETEFALQQARDQLGQRVYPVHRLDKPTSGVLIFALAPEYARRLAQQFTDHLVNKNYTAIVRGWPQDQPIDHPLKLTPDDLKGKTARAVEIQSAQTQLSTLRTAVIPVPFDRYQHIRLAEVKLVPITGRRHQLRRHMKHLSHPIIGDPKYGKGALNRLLRDELGLNRLMLHCRTMEFDHPSDGTPLRFSADYDAVFKSLYDHHNWSPYS